MICCGRYLEQLTNLLKSPEKSSNHWRHKRVCSVWYIEIDRSFYGTHNVLFDESVLTTLFQTNLQKPTERGQITCFRSTYRCKGAPADWQIMSEQLHFVCVLRQTGMDMIKWERLLRLRAIMQHTVIYSLWPQKAFKASLWFPYIGSDTGSGSAAYASLPIKY